MAREIRASIPALPANCLKRSLRGRVACFCPRIVERGALLQPGREIPLLPAFDRDAVARSLQPLLQGPLRTGHGMLGKELLR